MSEVPKQPEFFKPTEVDYPEISPEVLEMVMEKVSDIDSPGTTFTVLNAMPNRGRFNSGQPGVWDISAREKLRVAENESEEAFADILAKGLLSKKVKDGDIKLRTRSGRKKARFYEKNYSNSVSEHFVWATILNRREPTEEEIRDNEFLQQGIELFKSGKLEKNPLDRFKNARLASEENSYWDLTPTNQIAIIIDPKPFKYFNSNGRFYKKSAKQTEDIAEVRPQEAKDADSGYYEGFQVPHRISPRHFQGVVLGKLYFNDQQFLERAKRLINKMLSINLKTPERLVPFYDQDGNLLWPKQMPHEEISKLTNEK